MSKDEYLTAPQEEVLAMVKLRTSMGGFVTTMEITKARGKKDRTWSFKVLKSLMKKGLVMRVKGKYYKIT